MRSLAGLIITGLVLLTTVTATPTARATPAAPNAGPVGLELIDLDPWVGSDTTVEATVAARDATNTVTIRPVLYDAVTTRSAFELTTQGENLVQPVRHFEDLTISPGRDEVRLRFGVTDGTETRRTDPVVLTRPGVYPLVFTANDDDGVPIDQLVTYLVRLPDRGDHDNGRHPLNVATQLRLQPRPTSDADGELTVSAAARTATEDLVAGVTGEDRLLQPARRQLGYTISPALLDAAARNGRADLVEDLQRITTGHRVQPQPWAPVSLAAWLTRAELAGELDRSSTQGSATLASTLTEPDPTWIDLPGWGDDLSPDALAWFTDRGTTGFLVDEADLEPLNTAAFPRTLAAPFELTTPTGPVVAAQLDRALAAHFEDPDPRRGANHLIADLSVIALDLPSIPRGVVVAPPAGTTPDAVLLAAYLDALEAAPPRGADVLLRPVTVDTVLDDIPTARAAGDTVTEGEPLTRTLVGEPAAVPAGLATQVGRARDLITSLGTMEPGGADEAALSIRWLDERLALAAMPGVDAGERRREFAAITTTVTGTATDVELSERQTITMTSEDASLPFTIRRQADGPTRVTVHIDAPDRLEFPDGRTRAVDLDDPVTRLDLRVHADSPGDTLVRITVTSPDGRLVAGSSELLVRSTAASGVGLIISFGSLAFLVIWWGRDIIRRRRRRRARRVPPAELIDIDGSGPESPGEPDRPVRPTDPM